MTSRSRFPFRAVLWDLDGTLYRQAPLRKRMLLELGKQVLRQSPGNTKNMLAWLKVFRSMREELRALGLPDGSLDRIQFEQPAARIGAPIGPFEELIREWIWERPLPFLARTVYPGLIPLLELFQSEGMPMGVYSDYPVKEKLKALGLDHFFQVQLCSTDPEVNAFKPHPRGFEYGAEQLGVPCSDVLFVGDRMDVDGEGAIAAGQDYRILDPKGNGPKTVRSYEEMARNLHV